MKRLRLDNYREVTVSNEAYERILTIVNANTVCRTCQKPYTKGNPQVEQNLCLACFHKKYARLQLSYIDEYARNDQGDVTHLFMDEKGYIYLTTTSTDQEPYASNFQTLMYHGFPVPKFLERDEKQVELSTWEWLIYGDVKRHSVLYIHHKPRTDYGIDAAFLTTRNGDTEFFNRRKGKYQKLYKLARERLEATKDQHGYYHVSGHAVAGIYDAYIYEMIAVIASAEYDQQRKQQPLDDAER